jgi:serine/threonine protein kinase
MLNKTINNYKIINEIGSGGMATAYLAEHQKLGNKAAIKVLKPELAAIDHIRQRFENEARIMASLNHPSIVRVLDYIEEPDMLAIVMEYLEGQNLDEWVQENGAMQQELLIPLFSKVLDAFEYAHDKNIVHRDIKPSNIFLDKNRDPKILDFGIAKLVQEGSKVLTQTGTQMGTPIYMSPEQVHDSKHIDHRSDIYSLGVTLWFCLAGKAPYNTYDESTFAIFKKIDSEPLPELNLSEDYNKIIRKATAKDKEARFGDCASFLQLLIVLKSKGEIPPNELSSFIEEKTVISEKWSKKDFDENVLGVQYTEDTNANEHSPESIGSVPELKNRHNEIGRKDQSIDDHPGQKQKALANSGKQKKLVVAAVIFSILSFLMLILSL